MLFPPEATNEVVKVCEKLGIRRIWMQKGSESRMALDFCKENDIEVVYGISTIIERRDKQL